MNTAVRAAGFLLKVAGLALTAAVLVTTATSIDSTSAWVQFGITGGAWLAAAITAVFSGDG